MGLERVRVDEVSQYVVGQGMNVGRELHWLWDPEAWVFDEGDSVDELGRSRERFVRDIGCAGRGRGQGQRF